MRKFDFCISGALRQMPHGPSELANKMLTYLEGVSRLDPLMVNWYRPGHSREDALAHPLVAGSQRTENAVRLLTEDCRPEDRDWVRACWNGKDFGDERSVVVSAELPPYGPTIGSTISLTYSRSGHVADVSASQVEAIMHLTVVHWPVRWARAFSSGTLAEVKNEWDEIAAGWITYVAGDTDVAPAQGVETIRGFAGRGTLFIASPMNPAPDDVTALERLRALSKQLWRYGLLPRRRGQVL